RRHTRFSRDWSSDVCSSDLSAASQEAVVRPVELVADHGTATGREMYADLVLPAREQEASDERIARTGREHLHVGASLEAFSRPRSEERRVGKEWTSRWAHES